MRLGIGQNSPSGMAPSFMVTIACQVLLPVWEPQETLPCRLPQRPWEEATGASAMDISSRVWVAVCVPAACL